MVDEKGSVRIKVVPVGSPGAKTGVPPAIPDNVLEALNTLQSKLERAGVNFDNIRPPPPLDPEDVRKTVETALSKLEKDVAPGR